MYTAFAAEVQTLFGPQTAVAAADPKAPATGLMPDETASTGSMVEKRHREFAAGRRAARAAMDKLGLPPLPVPMGPDRAPIWPDGIIGSISHTDTHCLASVARAGDIQSLGLDLEPDQPLEQNLWPEICTRTELDWLASQPGPAQGRLARLIFSAKECAYKAQYPLTGKVLGFDTVEITLNLQAETFTVTARQPIPPFAGGAFFQGRFARLGSALVAAAQIQGA